MKRNWLWLAGPWALFLALAIGWSAYWHIVAGEAERRLSAWVAQQQGVGASASVGAITRRGFPMLLRLELRDLSYAPARGGWRLASDRADFHLNLLNTEHLTIEARAPIVITRADGAATRVEAEALIATWRTRGGRLAQAGVEGDNLVLDDPAREGALGVRKLVANLRPDARAPGAYQFAVDAQVVTLPRPVRSFEAFGAQVQALRAAIVIEQGASLLRAGANDPLGPWREAGGRLRFEALALDWGPLQTTGTGEGALDGERRLSGALSFPIERPAPVLTALANGPGMDESARRALALLAAGYALSGEDITLDVEAREGRLRLEGLTVRPLPPVY